VHIFHRCKGEGERETSGTIDYLPKLVRQESSVKGYEVDDDSRGGNQPAAAESANAWRCNLRPTMTSWYFWGRCYAASATVGATIPRGGSP